MSCSRFHRLTDGAAIYAASLDAIAWGFPRPVEPVELTRADWFIGPGMVFWFEHYPISSTYFVHIAVRPEARFGGWPARDWLKFIERYAASQGATELGFVTGEDFAEADRYLRRLGWVETPYGLAHPVSTPEAA